MVDTLMIVVFKSGYASLFLRSATFPSIYDLFKNMKWYSGRATFSVQGRVIYRETLVNTEKRYVSQYAHAFC